MGKLKKIILSILVVSSMLTSVSLKVESYAKYQGFDIKEAINVGDEYIKNLNIGNVFKLIEVGEGTSHSYLNYVIARDDNEKIVGDLDNLIINVILENNKYSIEKVKDKLNKQVYIENNNLRIRDEELGRSQLLLSYKSFPKSVLAKETGNLKKQEILKGEYSKLSIGLDGKKVAIITTSDADNYISVALVEDSKGSKEKNNNKNEAINEETGEVLEKSIAEKLMVYDVINNAQIQKVNFSKDDGELMVQVKEEGRGSKLKIYKNPTGELISAQLDKNFPSDRYELSINTINQNGNFINVKEVGSEKVEVYELDIIGDNITYELK